MKKSTVILAIFALFVMVVEWKMASGLGAARAIHGYHGTCNAGVGEPYKDFMHQLRKLAESGNTNRLMSVLRRADEHSGDIYNVWLSDDRDAYRKSIQEILQ